MFLVIIFLGSIGVPCHCTIGLCWYSRSLFFWALNIRGHALLGSIGPFGHALLGSIGPFGHALLGLYWCSLCHVIMLSLCPFFHHDMMNAFECKCTPMSCEYRVNLGQNKVGLPKKQL